MKKSVICEHIEQWAEMVQAHDDSIACDEAISPYFIVELKLYSWVKIVPHLRQMASAKWHQPSSPPVPFLSHRGL